MYRFKLYDEDDPLAEFGEGYAPDYDTSSPPMVGQLQEPPDSLESLLSPDSGSYQPQPMMQGQDRELEQAYRNREMSALRASGDDGYGWAEGIRDVAPAAIGLLVDGIANKGRGAANIVGVTAQQAAGNQAYDRAQRHKEAELAVKLHQRNGQRYNDPYAAEKLRQADERIRLQGQGQQGVQGRFETNAASRDNFDSERNQTRRDMSYATRQQGTQAALDTRHDNIERTAGDEERVSGARMGGATNARTNALRDNPVELTEDQKLDNARADEQLEVSRELRQQGAERAAGDKRIAHVNEFNTKYKDALEMVAAANELRGFFQKKRDEGVTDMPGIGPLDSLVPDIVPSFIGGPNDDDKYVRNRVSAMQNPGLHARYGASLTPGERANAEREFGAMKGNDEAAILQAIESLYKTGSEKLRGASIGQEDIAREILTQRGLGHVLDGMEPAPAAAPPEGAPGLTPANGMGTKPAYTPRSHAARPTGDLGAPQPVPSIGTVMMSVNGEPPEPVPADLVEGLMRRAKAKGLTAEVIK